VSHSAIYSSITLLSVGVYLIASSLLARWASQYGDIGLPVEALIFFSRRWSWPPSFSALGSATALEPGYGGTSLPDDTIIASSGLKQRNVFRSIDPPDATAAALADIVHRALGAIDVSVWIRRRNPNRLHLPRK